MSPVASTLIETIRDGNKYGVVVDCISSYHSHFSWRLLLDMYYRIRSLLSLTYSKHTLSATLIVKSTRSPVQSRL